MKRANVIVKTAPARRITKAKDVAIANVPMAAIVYATLENALAKIVHARQAIKVENVAANVAVATSVSAILVIATAKIALAKLDQAVASVHVNVPIR